MSRRRALLQRLHSLEELGEILDSMQTLAVIETRKLTRCSASQQRVVAGIECAAAAFCSGFPDALERPAVSLEACLLLGSERGFCGDYNDTLLAAFADFDQQQPLTRRLLLVGNRLAMKLENDPRVLVRLNGASAAEEVPAVLGQVVDAVLELQSSSLGLTVVYHELAHQQVNIRRLLPPFETFVSLPCTSRSPPQIQLPPRQLLAKLVDHYLFASLTTLFYTALLVENQRRVQHLEAATRRLEEEISRLRLQANMLRQEEITEEIEVILLSTHTAPLKSPHNWPPYPII
jgi:F-type H+-transporting ATPase subunit gamma